MTRMLDIISSYLEQQGHRAMRIDGSIPWQERQAAIKNFNEDKVQLITTTRHLLFTVAHF